jgi:MFS family permease
MADESKEVGSSSSNGPARGMRPGGFGHAPAAWLRALAGRFTVLRGAVCELWIVFGAKLLAILAYGVMNSTLILWLSSDLGYNDADAGFLIAAWSTLMTLFTVAVGSLVDAIGLRKAFLMGFCVCLLARGMMTFTTARWAALLCGLLPLALGEALMTPVMVAAVRRYTTTAQRSISFSIFYAMMNGGFLIALLIYDYVRQSLGEYGHYTVPVLGVSLSTYRTLFLVSFLLTVPNLLLMYFCLRNGVEATDEGVKITREQPKYTRESMGKALSLTIRDALRDMVRIFAGLWRQPAFYKFLVFLSLVVAVRLIFYHMYYTYPKFGIRELGEGAPIGRLWAINSILILILVPIVGALSQRIAAFRMVVYGSLISALSVFLMAMPLRWFQPLADHRPGHLIANVWLGGYSRISVSDLRNLPSLADKLQNPSNALSVFLSASLSDKSRDLLRGPRGAAFVSPLFSASDILDVPSFARKLQQRSDSLCLFLRQSLSPKTRELLDGYQKNSPETGPLQAALAGDLNRILAAGPVYETNRFAGRSLSEPTKKLLGQEPADQELLRLNRLLLGEVFSRELAKLRPLQSWLAGDLTRIIQAGPLYDPQRFAGIGLSEETKQWLARKPQGGKQAHLNRLLLEDAFPQELARNRLGEPGSVNPYYVIIFLYVVVLSLGEALWSPRLYEYTAAIAPKGQEASYMSLSYLPFFVAKFFVGMFSGLLLTRYCPETGPRDSQTLWLIIALTTLITPVGLLLLRRYIQVREAGREP